MNSPVLHPQVILAAVGTLGQFAANHVGAKSNRDQLRQELALAELRAGALAHVVDAVITRKINLVQEGFLQVLRDISIQAQHYMAQQQRYASDELDARDPLRRIELRKRINDIDIELRQIRLDARLLYTRMTEVVLLIGGPPSLPLDDGMASPLMLSAPAR